MSFNLSSLIKERVEETFLNEQIINEAVNLLYEKLVVFGGGKKYGQVVFLSGGAGSGKGFASGSFMESDKFKVRDVDEWKKTFLKISELRSKYPEIRGLDLSRGEDVAKLHMFVKKLGIKEKTLDMMLRDVKQDRLPNIMFDITGKDLSDFEEVIPHLKDVGYDSKNIHVSWILANYKVSYVANMTRERVVPAPIFLGTHRGAANTMKSLIDRKQMPRGADGRFVVVLNNRENTIYFEPGGKYKGKTIPMHAKNVKGFYYISIKEAGKSFKSEDEWKEELEQQIEKNIPGGEASVDRLRKHALDQLEKDISNAKDDKSRNKAQRGVDLIKRDVRQDRIARKLAKSRRNR